MDNSTKKYIHHLQFENKLLKAEGKEFETLFADIMEQAFPGDFQRVRPHGRYGDWKCDGYQKNNDTVFQCYAPQTMHLPVVRKKINEDFQGAYDRWEHMKSWVFVHNDRRGLPPEIVEQINDLNRDHPGIEVTNWGISDLHLIADGLTLEQRSRLFGPPVDSRDMQNLVFEDLAPVIKKIEQEKPPIHPPMDPPSPLKLEKNKLSEDVADLLRLGRRRENLVQGYFDSHPDPDMANKITAGFHKRYEELKKLGYPPDQIFDDLQNFAGGMDGSPRYQATVVAILSYFFERCDIFENNPTESSS